MTTINHHPSDDVLLRYVSGGYDTGYSLILATHISLCEKCQSSVAMHQHIGGQALDAQSPTEMSVSALDLLDNAPEPANDRAADLHVGYSKQLGMTVPPILNTYLPQSFDALKWQRLSPSLKQHVLTVEGKAVARMLWMAPGKAVPAHGHSGEEISLIMSGGYFDGDEAYTAGDLHWADHKTPHVPVAMDDAPCLVLAATDSPLQFSNFIPRLLQPLFKI